MEVGREERRGLLGGSVDVEHLPYKSDGCALQWRCDERRREPQALYDLGDTRVIDGARGVTLAEAAAEERVHRLLGGGRGLGLVLRQRLRMRLALRLALRLGFAACG